MSLIVKADMPANCLECRNSTLSIPKCPLRKHTQGNWYHMGSRHPDCPIVGEISDNHGELTEKDKLLMKATQYCQGCKIHNCQDCWVTDMLDLIGNAPVVVGASNG